MRCTLSKIDILSSENLEIQPKIFCGKSKIFSVKNKQTLLILLHFYSMFNVK